MDVLNQASSKSNHSNNSHERSISKKLNIGKFEDKFVSTYHHYGIVGHITAYCFNLNKVQKNGSERK